MTMQNDLIRRSDALKCGCWEEWKDDDGWEASYVIYTEDIEQLPSVDAVEVIHAYWRDCFQDSHLCSHCKYTVPKIDYGHKYPYCPHCGAKMDGEVADNDPAGKAY